jgi:TPR repeat protein
MATSSTSDSSPSLRFEKEEPDVCCICLDELSSDEAKNTRALCCGKQWHVGCQKNVMKSTMPDELKNRCHQCRKPIPETIKGQIEQLREWVDKGEAWAQAMMAALYREGQFGLKQSYVMAAMLFEKAVAQGDSVAMYNLALLYENGKGVVQSFKKAAELNTMAAEQGHVDAMTRLGMLYTLGLGVVQSIESAREWWTKAAIEGQEEAIMNLKKFDELEALATATTTSTSTKTTTTSRSCAACNTPQTNNHPLNRCKCHSVHYCNATCQRAHWGTHQEEHRRLVQEKKATKNASENNKKVTSTTTTTSSTPPPQSKKEGDNDKKETTTKQSSTAASSSHQQNEKPDVCCICLDELPIDPNKLIRFICCGKLCCLGCQKNVQKSTMPDDLKHRCHQCRKPFPKNDEEQIERLREWLDKDEAWAQGTMGQWYRDGKYGLKQSYVMAAMLFEKAVAQGDSVAMYNLACLYRDGQGVEQSYNKTTELIIMALDQGMQTLDEGEGKSRTTAPTTASAPPPPVFCSSCNKPQPRGHTFPKCKGCRTVQYCNKECQRAHWSPGGHKQACKRLKKKKEKKKKGSSSSQNKKSK